MSEPHVLVLLSAVQAHSSVTFQNILFSISIPAAAHCKYRTFRSKKKKYRKNYNLKPTYIYTEIYLIANTLVEVNGVDYCLFRK